MVPTKKRRGRKKRVDALISREARRIVERDLRRYEQTTLPLWGEPEGRPPGSPQDTIAPGGEGEEPEGQKAPESEKEGH